MIRTMTRVAHARELADRLHAGDALTAPTPVTARRSVALGDPQAATDKLFALLDHHGLLGEDGWLRPDVQLVSIGDHFDFGTRAQGTIARARRDGPRFLRWLAAHPPSQVTILFGNHDAARVMELAFADDERFDAASDLADELLPLRDVEPHVYRERVAGEYANGFPELPGPGLVQRHHVRDDGAAGGRRTVLRLHDHAHG
ncbi:MAG: metallophosphoesterase, partial [Rhodoglobus sp.]